MDEFEIRDDFFEEQFDLFRQKLRYYGNGEEFKSFAEGTPEKWELYKRYVYIEGRDRLDSKSWKREDIGTGKIIDKTIKAIEIHNVKSPGHKTNLENNLLQWTLKNGEKGRTHNSLYESLETPQKTQEYEQVLFNFYQNITDDETSFNRFMDIAGRKYPFIAYLFFLKNREIYLPIAPETFDTAFRMLQIPFKTGYQCSWDNYQNYLKIIGHIKEKIEIKTGLTNIELIDAHSFCWMLVKLPVPAKITPYKADIPTRTPLKIEPQKTVSFPALVPKEGLKISYDDYLKKYQKNHNVGRKAEIVVCRSEQKRLIDAEKPELAKKVKRVSDNPSLGYDIESRDIDGTKMFIEVKAVRSLEDILSFYLSRNEWEKSQSMDNYYFYFVSCSKEQKHDLAFIQGKELLPKYIWPSEYLVKLPLIKR
jgi:hypothetical protein